MHIPADADHHFRLIATTLNKRSRLNIIHNKEPHAALVNRIFTGSDVPLNPLCNWRSYTCQPGDYQVIENIQWE